MLDAQDKTRANIPEQHVQGAFLVQNPFKDASFQGTIYRCKSRYRGKDKNKYHPFYPFYLKKNDQVPTKYENFILGFVAEDQTGVASPYRVLDVSLIHQNPAIVVQRVFCALSNFNAVAGVINGDYSPLQRLGATAWLGNGFYFTPDINYALHQSSACEVDEDTLELLGGLRLIKTITDSRIILVCDIVYGNAFPVVDSTAHVGAPLISRHDCHVAVVDYSGPTVKLAQPIPPPSSSLIAGEVVISDPAHVRPRAILLFPR